MVDRARHRVNVARPLASKDGPALEPCATSSMETKRRTMRPRRFHTMRPVDAALAPMRVLTHAWRGWDVR